VHNVQTTTVPAGGSAITEFKMSVPGTFIIVDHSLERAFNRGALAQLKVTGPDDKLVYSGKQSDLVYQPEGTGIRVADQPPATAPVAKSKDERIAIGAGVFANNCQACHQAGGEGVPDAFPPLAKSDYLNGDKVRAIKTVTGGLQTKVTVNGKDFNGVMPAWTLSDEEIADVLTYVYSKWGNSAQEVTPAEVKFNRVAPN
jgi:nitrite reductase (NO-forming)